jgi:hypothetical protein
MGYRLLKGGAAQRLVAGVAPPFDGRVREPRLHEVMRQRFRLGRRRCGEAVAQNLGDATAPRSLWWPHARCRGQGE